MMDAISIALDRFLKDDADDLKKMEAEAAVALLIDLADLKDHPKYVRFDGGYMASELGVWNKAIAAIRLLISQKKWLAQWNDPEGKAEVLRQLAADLELATKGTASNESQDSEVH